MGRKRQVDGGEPMRRPAARPPGITRTAAVITLPTGCDAQQGCVPGRLAQAGSRSEARMRERSCSTDLVWIWHTRLSVTPSTWPISARVRPS
jgi:hypothetical protein